MIQVSSKGRPLSLDCFGTTLGTLKTLLSGYTLSVLNRTGGSNTTDLITALRQVENAGFAEQIQEEFNSPIPRNWETDPPFVIHQKLPVGDVILTMDQFSTGAYALPSGVVIIQAFRKEAREYVLADQVGDSLFGLLYYRRFEVPKVLRQISFGCWCRGK